MKRFRQLIGDGSSYVFIFPAVVVLGLFLIYPIIWSLIASFKNIQPILMKNSGLFSIPGSFAGLSNYVQVLKDPLFIKSIVNTLYFGVIFVPVTMIISFLLALLVNRKLKGVNFFRTIIFMPYVISVVSSSLIFMFLFNGSRGLVDALLYKFGIMGPDWLASTVWAMPVIAIMSCWRNIGYFMLIYLAGLQNIPHEINEAAAIDGASRFQKLRLVTWPSLARINLVVVILLLIDSLNIFQEVYVMTGGGPANSTVTVPFLIYNEAFTYFRIGPAAAMSYILFVIVLIIALVQKRATDKKLR